MLLTGGAPPPPPPHTPTPSPTSSAPRSLRSASAPIVFVYINRYERKKAIELAIDAFAALQLRLPPAAARRTHLVISGGYDTRMPENVQYYEELLRRARDSGVVGAGETPAPRSAALPDFSAVGGGGAAGGGREAAVAAAPPALYAQVQAFARVTFVRSFTDEQKARLLRAATAVLYTPSREHFGIVPIEAMAACRLVIACADGGPLESVDDGTTGLLCEPTPDVS